jgi:sugar phosphate isomerase/epimerase
MQFQYAVNTVMLPECDLEEAAALIRRFGYDGVEWRVSDPSREPPGLPGYWSGNRCTIDLRKLEEELPRVRAICRAEGLSAPALGSYVGAADTENVRRCMEFARELGCPQIRVRAPMYHGDRPYAELFEEGVRQLEGAADLAKELGVRANIELHAGSICPSASLGHRLVSRFDPQYVGVICDPGNMATEGYENWRLGMELLGPYLAHVHAKNVEWRYGTEQAGTIRFNPHWTQLQEGVVAWDEVLKALDRVGYSGWIAMEDFSEMRADRKLKDDLAYLRNWEKGLSAA